MSTPASAIPLDALDTFLRTVGYTPDTVEEVHFNGEHLDIVTTAADGCSVNARHRLVENPVAAVVRDAIARATNGQHVAVLFNTQAEAAAALRAVYDRREKVLEGIAHTIYLAAGRLDFSPGRVDFINVRGNAYRGQTWDVAYHPLGIPARVMWDFTTTVPSGRFTTY